MQVFELERKDGLVPIWLNYRTGEFVGDYVRLGSRGDSYYGIAVLYNNLEYLAKQWIQTNYTEKAYENEWRAAVVGIRKKLLGLSKPNGYLFVGESDGGHFTSKMDHLVCFLPGTLALAATRGKRVNENTRSMLNPRDQQDLDVNFDLLTPAS